MYPAPWLIRAYVLDVNEKWPEVRQIIDRVSTTMQNRLSRTERLALDLYERAFERGLGGEDFAAVMKLIEDV